jgi:uncharacterized protein YkwD
MFIPAASRSRTEAPDSSGGIASISTEAAISPAIRATALEQPSSELPASHPHLNGVTTATADLPSAEKEHPMLSTATQLPTRARRRAGLLIVLAALLGAVGTFASSARADDGLLPLPGTCANENNGGTDWGSVDAQRAAVACLINQVRAKAGLPQLSYCTTSVACNYITTGTNPVYTHSNAAALYTAAQWKAMDVDYGIDEPSYGSPCSAPNNGAAVLNLPVLQQFGLPKIPAPGTDPGTMAYTYANPHYACSRPSTWWDDVVMHVSRTPDGVTNFKENLAPGFRQVDGINYPSTPRAVVNSWLTETQQPPLHRLAILDPTMRLMGVGVSPAWYGNIASGPINQGGSNWGTYRQVYAVQFIR